MMTQAGFSEAQRIAALELKARIQSGEPVPLEDLRKFILSAEKDLEENRIQTNKRPVVEKKTDVDFF